MFAANLASVVVTYSNVRMSRGGRTDDITDRDTLRLGTERLRFIILIHNVEFEYGRYIACLSIVQLKNKITI